MSCDFLKTNVSLSSLLLIYSGHILSFYVFIPAMMAVCLPLSPARKLPVLTELMSLLVLVVIFFYIFFFFFSESVSIFSIVGLLCLLALFDTSSLFRESNTESRRWQEFRSQRAALMFNSSVFVLIQGNLGLPLGVSMCRRPRVCCCVEMS